MWNKKKKKKKKIKTEETKNKLRKISNWKAPNPDFVQGFWLKCFRSIQERL